MTPTPSLTPRARSLMLASLLLAPPLCPRWASAADAAAPAAATPAASAASAASEANAKDVPRSNRGDYVGDCFLIKNDVPGLAKNEGTRHWLVTEQDSRDPNDPVLTLIPASDWGHSWVETTLQRALPILGCTPKTSHSTPARVHASDFNRHGAIRRGFVYGMLTTPYKYFPGSKRFQAGAPVGPYLGWRIGQSGVGGAFVTAITLGAVEGDTVKADPTDATKQVITGHTTLMALSAAAGLIFDITRNPSKSPIKVGLLAGQDWVNSADNVKYDHNRKTWVAIQIGFDFTDY